MSDSNGVAITALSMQNDIRWVDTIAQNIANAATDGYRRKIPLSAPVNSFNQLIHSPIARENALDFKAGAIKMTGNPSHLSIEGDAFFEVQSNGQLLYTRNGLFHLDEHGYLVTNDGYAVMGNSGPIKLETTHFTIEPTGDIYEGTHLAGSIKRVSFENPNELTEIISNYFIPTENQTAEENRMAWIRQGTLETSNVNTAHEMLQLIQLVRHFEMSQKVIQTYDSLTDKSIQSLGSF